MSNSIQIQASAEPAGNPGEIQWNDNGDFGASSSLFWDNANGRLGIGTNTPQSRLDIRAQGALSTDIALRVRNSADTIDFLQFSGDGNFIIGANQSNEARIIKGSAALLIHSGISSLTMQRFASSTPVTLNTQGQGFLINANTGQLRFASATYGTNFQIIRKVINFSPLLSTNDLASISDSNAIILGNGTVPITDYANRFLFYSADITAGNAAPHFRTENGDVVKLYAEADAAVSFSANTGDANTDAMINFLMSHLKNMGIVKEL